VVGYSSPALVSVSPISDHLFIPQEILDELMETLSALITQDLPSSIDEAQQRSWVTYDVADRPDVSHNMSLALLERRAVISGSGTTGLRTWEAALHFGSYLLSSSAASAVIRDKHVLELGGGTGFLSILSRKLGAAAVSATDGSPEVIDALRENIAANGCDNVTAGVLRWGWSLQGSVVMDAVDTMNRGIDTVIAADVVCRTLIAHFALADPTDLRHKRGTGPRSYNPKYIRALATCRRLDRRYDQKCGDL